jgi:hypothetical protein
VKVFLSLGAALTLFLSTSASAQYYGIIVPAFDGPRPLGQNVSTNLYLQVWRTLRRAPYPNPLRLDFGSGIAQYTDGVFRPKTEQEITRYVVQNGTVQLVMWGEVRPLGSGVLIQAFLAAPSEAAHPAHNEVWTIRRGNSVVRLDLPRRTFTFAPVVLDRALIQVLQSPDSMRMCRRPVQPCDEMDVGPDWNGVRQSGAWAEVVSNTSNETGFIYLPTLARLPNDISDFAAALLSYERGDFAQAARLFSRVASRDASESSTREDAAVLGAIARLRAGDHGGNGFTRLEAQFPESLYVFQAATMAQLERALGSTGSIRTSLQQSIFKRIRDNAELFESDDPWLKDMETILDRL